MALANNSNEFDKFRDGSQSAFRSLYNKYHSRLHQFIFKRCQDKQLAQHILLSIFLNAWDRRARFGDENEFLAYLYFAAACKCLVIQLDDQRRKTAENEWVRSSDTSCGDEREKEMSRSHSIDMLWTAIMKLPPQQGTVIHKRMLEGKNFRQIAAEMKLAEQTVRNHHARALLFLRNELTGLEFLFLLVVLLLNK